MNRPEGTERPLIIPFPAGRFFRGVLPPQLDVMARVRVHDFAAPMIAVPEGGRP